jgi:hypothetical protein
MTEEVAPALGPQQIDAALKFLTVFERPGCSFGTWSDAGYFAYSPEVDDFVQTLYAQGVLVQFDWPSWQPEAQRYATEPEALKGADLMTLRKLLTTHVRADRFAEGHLASVLESGHMLAILRRLKDIRQQSWP